MTLTFLRRGLAAVFLLAASAASAATPLPNNQQPKYGSSPKSEAERTADTRFITEMTRAHGGDRQQAAVDAATRGWQAFRAGSVDDAMRRFNQAWLLDPGNAEALWGMGAVTGSRGDVKASVALFGEAEPALRGRLAFRVDHARTLAMAALATGDPDTIDAALARFAALDREAPNNLLNVQNWAIALMQADRDDEAWALVQRAQAVRRDAMDPRFVADLAKKRAGGARAPTPAKPAATPELWSGHRELTVPADVCAERAQALLERLAVGQVQRNQLYTYGNADRHRIAVKCVPLAKGSFVYYAVAGGDRAKAEAWRDRIAEGW
jgi:tetratricopeptide (TPR) repeat protein